MVDTDNTQCMTDDRHQTTTRVWHKLHTGELTMLYDLDPAPDSCLMKRQKVSSPLLVIKMTEFVLA